MTANRTLIAPFLLITLPIGAVFAQTDQASTADRVLSTGKVPNTTAVGQTKPPSRDASPTSLTPIERRTPDQVSNDAIVAKICVRCAPEPATGDPLSEDPSVRLAGGARWSVGRTHRPARRRPEHGRAETAIGSGYRRPGVRAS